MIPYRRGALKKIETRKGKDGDEQDSWQRGSHGCKIEIFVFSIQTVLGKDESLLKRNFFCNNFCKTGWKIPFFALFPDCLLLHPKKNRYSC